jgi:hypothetical protein
VMVVVDRNVGYFTVSYTINSILRIGVVIP